ncbi:hypothetical protein G3I19_22705 [Streptomyces sp. SID10853]|uniref:hypothetical protein n=1 Tax=Streptomyces sp. SID10853 TaxID=2706028 RepID=UPI0013C0B144|nr:hypothetical protein [Streptomyces sp. SID10853]NDZ81290.1 hypothetical protein [Streptomyces sp. SID10853]
MSWEHKPATGQRDAETVQLADLVAAGGFWRLAPAWVPRTGYAPPTKDLLRDVIAGLERQLDRMSEQPEFEISVLKWPPCRCGNPVCPDAPADDVDESSTTDRLRERIADDKGARP